jgi:ribosomal protein S18 acetylase RimI-like enzyme
MAAKAGRRSLDKPGWIEDVARCDIVWATNAERIDAVRGLFREYATSLDFDLAFQDFDRELAALPGGYAPPEGCLLLARYEGWPVGCVGVRRSADGICEMKRLYVCPSCRGLHIGHALARAAIAEARSLGYRWMRLDTVPGMEKAQGLYQALGFYEIDVYRYNPIAGARYMELDLQGGC